ncbi:MotA/TolQ/ExbB proton channel family protein [Lachnobacterium bovis]
MGPAWGMIGTLVGLVNMLKNLSEFINNRSFNGGSFCLQHCMVH